MARWWRIVGTRQAGHQRTARSPTHPRRAAPSQACRTSPGDKGKFIKTILALLTSPSPAVMYECAVTLTSLSSAPSAVRAAANCFCSLLARCARGREASRCASKGEAGPMALSSAPRTHVLSACDRLARR
jgi:hypothetical protein